MHSSLSANQEGCTYWFRATFWEFTKMWRNKSTAKLSFSCEGGNLNLELAASLGNPDDVHHEVPRHHIYPVKRKSPAELRRNQRRHEAYLLRKEEAAQVSSKSNEEAVEASVDNTTAEKAAVMDDESIYELKIDASENCTEEDIIECFGINFTEARKDKKIIDEKSDFKMERVPDKHIIKKNGEVFESYQMFKVKIKNVKEAIETLECFDEKRGGLEWDYQAFKNYKRNQIVSTIIVKDVKKVSH